jgi:hypothetical protein
MAAFWYIGNTEGEEIFLRALYSQSASLRIAVPSCLATRKNGVLGVSPLLFFGLNIRQRVREGKLKIRTIT